MGYVKQQHIAEVELEFFLESAKAGTIEEHYPSLEGTFETRNLPIDTRGNHEDRSGIVYPFGDVQVFVPDECWMMIQPIVEQRSLTYPTRPQLTVIETVRPSDDDEDVGYHGLRMSDF